MARRICPFFSCVRYNQSNASPMSYLFTAGTKHDFVVEPDLDALEARVLSPALKRSLAVRRISSNVDTDQLGQRIAQVRKDLRNCASRIEELQQKVALANSDTSVSDLNKIKAEMRETKLSFKSVRAEAAASIHNVLRLPNHVLADWMLDNRFVLQEEHSLVHSHSTAEAHDQACRSVHEILQSHECFELREDPPGIYLKDKAAHVLLAMEEFLRQKFQSSIDEHEQPDFIEIIPSHFVKTAVLEGCGLDCEDVLTALRVAETTGSGMHLVGHSLASMLGLLTAKVFSPNVTLPLHLFSVGATYEGFALSQARFREDPLFLAPQFPSLCILVAATDPNGLEREFQRLSQFLFVVLQELFEGKVCFRSVQVPAVELLHTEMARVDLEGWRSASKSYQTFGHVSHYGTYLSERLRIQAEDRAGKQQYVSIVFAQLNILRLLALLVEADQTFVIPKVVQPCFVSSNR